MSGCSCCNKNENYLPGLNGREKKRDIMLAHIHIWDINDETKALILVRIKVTTRPCNVAHLGRVIRTMGQGEILFMERGSISHMLNI